MPAIRSSIASGSRSLKRNFLAAPNARRRGFSGFVISWRVRQGPLQRKRARDQAPRPRLFQGGECYRLLPRFPLLPLLRLPDDPPREPELDRLEEPERLELDLLELERPELLPLLLEPLMLLSFSSVNRPCSSRSGCSLPGIFSSRLPASFCVASEKFAERMPLE